MAWKKSDEAKAYDENQRRLADIESHARWELPLCAYGVARHGFSNVKAAIIARVTMDRIWTDEVKPAEDLMAEYDRTVSDYDYPRNMN